MAERIELPPTKVEILEPISGVDRLTQKHPFWSQLVGNPLEIDVLQRHMGNRRITVPDAAPRFRELLEQNPAWLAIFEEFGDSPKHFARLMVTLFADRFLAYSDIYKVASRLNIGESTKTNPRLFNRRSVEIPEFNTETSQVHDILVDYAISSRLKNFSKDKQQVLLDLATLIQEETSETKKVAYREALDFLIKMGNLKIPAFKNEIDLRPHQARAALKGLHKGVPEKTRLGIFHDTRTGKTLTTLARFESLGVNKALIVVPASLKTLWKDEIEKFYTETPGTIMLESDNIDQALEQASRPDTKYVIVSYDLLVRRTQARRHPNYNERNLVKKLAKIGFDGLVADESHVAANGHNRTQRSKLLQSLSSMRSINHLILATATPVDRIEDISFTAHLLDPVAYPTPNAFSEQLHNNPRLCHNDLLALVDRVKAEEVMELPTVREKERVPLELTPTQQTLYEFILAKEDIHPFSKLNALRAISTHQRLLKGFKIEFDENEQMRWLSAAYMEWRKLSEKNPRLNFDSDFLSSNEHYFKHVYLPCLFNLKGGVTELINRSFVPAMVEHWRGESVPAKFIEIENQVRERLDKGEKIIIATGHRTEGITKDFQNTNLDQETLDSLLQHLQRVFGNDHILKIDGEDSTDNDLTTEQNIRTSKRELIRKQWKNDRSKDILLISAGAAGQGMDLSIEDPTVTGVTMIVESLPFSFRKYIQLLGRIMSDKQKSPVSFLFLEGVNTVDSEILNLIEEKGIPIEMLLDAVALTEEEEDILHSSPESIQGALARMIKSPRQNLAWMFEHMVGKSSQTIREFFSSEFRKGETNEEYMAKHFDELLGGYPGNTTHLVKLIAQKLIEKGDVSPEKIADFGSGPLVLARALGFPVTSLDLSPIILEEGIKKLQEQGIHMPENMVRAADITNMPRDIFPDNYFDLGVCSLALDCTPPGEERVNAINEMARTIKEGKYLLVTIPSKELDATKFKHFLQTFRELGLADDLSLSGYIKGMNNGNTTFNGWLFVLKKIAEPGIVDPNDLLFSFDGNAQPGENKKTEKMLQRLVRERAAKSSRPEEFSVCVPIEDKRSDSWPERGSVSELLDDTLLKHLLDLTDTELQSLGYSRQFVFRDGKQEVVLVGN